MIKFILKSAASLRSMTPETRSEPNLDRKPQSGPMPSRKLTLWKPRSCYGGGAGL